ncbi:hypothetical protein ACMGDM_19590 [Sphingomonas sp. DT-51]|uniref:hypothetical protein n=1 Tax=Sphingomonas sp. DT-51 TaxID=3396165 RepID=UPI003F1C5BEE
MRLTTTLRSKRYAPARNLRAELLSRNGICPRCDAAPAGSVGVCVFCYTMGPVEALPVISSRGSGPVH